MPYKIHTVLTDNGIQFTFAAALRRSGRPPDTSTHMFDRAAREHGIEHRLTKLKHPWTNGQVERMNRTIKDATVKRYPLRQPRPARQHLADFVAAYNFGRRLEDPERSHTLRVHLQMLDNRARNDSGSTRSIKCRD